MLVNLTNRRLSSIGTDLSWRVFPAVPDNQTAGFLLSVYFSFRL